MELRGIMAEEHGWRRGKKHIRNSRACGRPPLGFLAYPSSISLPHTLPSLPPSHPPNPPTPHSLLSPPSSPWFRFPRPCACALAPVVPRCAPDEQRYWYAGRWQTNRQLYLALEVVRKRLPRDAVVCAMAAVHGQVPCLHAPCVLTVHLRPYYSDFSVLKQLVETDEFGFIKHFRPRSVLDAGANVGYATLIFSTFFPNATVVAIEASDKNYEVLRRNTYRLRNVYAVHAGLFNHSGMVLLRNGTQTKTREGWQYVVTPVPSNSSGDTNEGDTNEDVQEAVEGEANSSNSSGVASTGAAEGGVTIRGVTVGDVLKQVGLARFDFVKMDIEGSEAEVLAMSPLAAGADWRLLARSGEYLVLENERWSERRGGRGGVAGQRAEDRGKVREVQRKEVERRKEGTKEEGRVQQGVQAGSGEGQRGEVKGRR
ncbi:unnamed protein product [Closterium sp. Naga37s-1]|nr:unnamed protein product [Closterium sp. Naga37s-1]